MPFSSYRGDKNVNHSRLPFHLHPKYYETYPQVFIAYDVFAFASFLWFLFTQNTNQEYPLEYGTCLTEAKIRQKMISGNFPECPNLLLKHPKLYECMKRAWKCDHNDSFRNAQNYLIEFEGVLKNMIFH